MNQIESPETKIAIMTRDIQDLKQDLSDVKNSVAETKAQIQETNKSVVRLETMMESYILEQKTNNKVSNNNYKSGIYLSIKEVFLVLFVFVLVVLLAAGVNLTGFL